MKAASTRSSLFSRLSAVAAVTTITLGMLIASGTAVWAAPTPEELERQIDVEWNKLEPVIERYNMVHGQLAANRVKSARLQQQLQPLQLQVDLALDRVGQMAASMYMRGSISAFNAVLVSGSPTTLANQLMLLDQVARGQRGQISAVAGLRDRYAADKKAIDELVAAETVQDTQLAAQKKVIEARIAELQRLRQQAYGSSGAQGELRTGPCPAEYYPGKGGTAAAKACSLIGKPYQWAAAGPNSFDCSGLTMAAWAAAGVSLRHYTQWQWQDHPAVSRAQLRPGDLVFYYSDLHHMGIYVGDGIIVHAPRAGDFVRMRPLNNGMPIAGYRRPG